MEGLLIVGIYVVILFVAIKLADIKFVQKTNSPDTPRVLIRDSVAVYMATVLGIYVAIQMGGIAMGGATGKNKSVFIGMPDF
jgi:hypothetical protein